MNLDAFFDKIISRIKLIVGQCVIQACKYRDGEMVADDELLAGEKRRGIECSSLVFGAVQKVMLWYCVICWWFSQ